jgi:hypothetical protein
VDADARSWIDRVRADAPRRIGQWALVDAWLTRDEHTDRLVVHIGEHRVGTVQSSHFDRVMTAADLFDEDPVLTARLGPADNPDSTALLELALPRGTTY